MLVVAFAADATRFHRLSDEVCRKTKVAGDEHSQSERERERSKPLMGRDSRGIWFATKGVR